MTLTPAARRHRGKRHADYVPFAAWMALDKLSKADLMEIAWDFALRSAGMASEATAENAYDEMVDCHKALRNSGYQGTTKLPESLTVA